MKRTFALPILALLLLAGCGGKQLDAGKLNDARSAVNIARTVVGELETSLENGALSDWEHAEKARRIIPTAKEALDVLSKTLKLLAEGSKKEWVLFIDGQEQLVTSPEPVTLPGGEVLTPLPRPLTAETLEARRAALSELVAEITELLSEVRELLRDA